MKSLLFNVLLIVLGVGLGLWGWSAYRQQSALVVLRWTTENEFDILGFNLYRSACSHSTVEIKINEYLIAAKGGVGSQIYHYTDTIDPKNAETCYQLETLYRDGRTERRAELIE